MSCLYILEINSLSVALFADIFLHSAVVFLSYLWLPLGFLSFGKEFAGNVGKRLPAMQETWVQSLGWEDPPEKEMVTHSSILAWRIPWAEKPDRLQSTGSQRVGHD